MKNNDKIFELENRYCPICGNFIKASSPTHRCLDKDIKKIDKERKFKESNGILDEDRTYDDKLNEFEEFYNSDNYYDNDVEEE